MKPEAPVLGKVLYWPLLLATSRRRALLPELNGFEAGHCLLNAEPFAKLNF